MPHGVEGFWGKIKRVDPDEQTSAISAWLPLEHHCSDVAAVFEALMAIRGIRRRASRLLGRKLTQLDVSRLSVIAFLHDIGKGNAGFQFKIFTTEERAGIHPAGHLAEAGAFLTNERLLQMAVDRLPLRAMETWFKPGSLDLLTMLAASWSHHGIPLAVSVDVEGLDGSERPEWREHEWSSPEAVLDLFAKEIRKNFPDAFVGSISESIYASPRFQAFFAGILCLADWIGSSSKWFGFADHGMQERISWSRKRAVQVLEAMGFDVEAARSSIEQDAISYIHIFGFTPNSMQAEMQAIDIKKMALGSTVLLESETGSGKTEAAIYHAVRLFAAGLVDSVYFALPTRTSGVQIHSRLHLAVGKLFGQETAPPVVLAVPGYQTVADRDHALLPSGDSRWDDDLPGGRRVAHNWYAENAKRYLAAPFAAGTIDQVLLSGLRTKHAHLRAACLARSLLIVDEVHASDTYMSEITAEVVRRHTAGGGHVLLMSATLAASAATKFLGGREPDIGTASELPYPLIRWRADADLQTVSLGDGATSRVRDIQVKLVSCIGNAAAVAAQAASHALQGARVLVIRNTVGSCTQVRQELERLLPPGMLFRAGPKMIHTCHHGRYAAEDRRMLDKAVEAEFGRKRPAGGMVLVATQTVEQSLDIDADVLVTDLCPMDVLLQRIGRLHRHERPSADGEMAARPHGYDQPLCIVLEPDDMLALTRRAGHGIGLERAYQDVRIVELTRRQIVQHGRFVIPRMNRPLVEACMHSSALAALDAEDSEWIKHRNKVQGGAVGDRLSARSSLLCIDEPFGTKAQFSGWDSAARIQTRLGASPVSAVFKEGSPVSPFGDYRLPIIAIPYWMAPQAIKDAPKEEAVPVLVKQDADGFRFRFGGEHYSYDSDGLAKA